MGCYKEFIILDQIAKLTFFEVHNAPDKPGIYAWYADLAMSAADLRHEIVGENDVGARRFRHSIARHTARFDPPPTRLSSRSAFGGKWRGQINDSSRLQLRRLIAGEELGDSASQMATKLAKATKDEGNRKMLADLLKQSTPFLSAPLYIGVTNSLQRRLKEHTELFMEVRDAVKRDDQMLSRLKQGSGELFAHRAVAAELEADHLLVYVQPAGLGENTEAILHSAEWLLNRWHRPLLGRN